MGLIGEKNTKLKEDYLSNKAKLLAGSGVGTQQLKRVASMDIVPGNNLPVNVSMNQQNAQFRHQQTRQVVHVIPSTQTPYSNILQQAK